MKSRVRSRALRHAASLLVLAGLLGCGAASEEAPPAHAPIIGRYPMRPLITDPRVAKEIGRKELAKIGYDEIIRLAVEKDWLRYPQGNADHVLVQAAPASASAAAAAAAAAAGFWPVFTPYAVTAGVTSQVDTPAPGPADLVAFGILVIGLIDAGLLDGTILNSIDVLATVPNTTVDAEKGIAEAARRRRSKKDKCTDGYEECMDSRVGDERGNTWNQTRCGLCLELCGRYNSWPSQVRMWERYESCGRLGPTWKN